MVDPATGIDTGATAWMLVAAALVFFMTPGLAFFYAGFVGSKNVLGTLMHCFIAIGVVGVLWVVVGYSLAFAPSVQGWGVIGNLDYFGLKGVGAEPLEGDVVPHQLFMIFQAMFAIITPALIVGAFAERAKFGPFLVFIAAWSLLVYAPVAHWIWGGGFIGEDIKALDFAGGTAIHVNAGAAALAAAIMYGRRKGYGTEPLEPHNVPFIILGAGMLWFGWFGFNAGSAVAADGIAVNAFTVTNTAAATAALSWVAMSWIVNGKPSVVGAAAGCIAGLVAITPAAGDVQPMEAIGIGGIAGVVCFLFVQWRSRSSLDDSLDVVGVHGIGGLWGALATGIFATAALSGGVDGLTNGGGFDQLWRQAAGVAIVAPFSFAVTFIILKVLDLTVGIRLNDEDEVAGMDVSEHGERGYVFGGSGPVLGIPEAIPVHTPAPSANAMAGEPVTASHPGSAG